MRYAVVSISVLVVSGLATTRAETLNYSTVGPWTISVDPSTANGCFVVADFVGGTSLRLGFDMTRLPKISFYTILGNVKWRSIEYGKNYPIQLRFGSRPAWTGDATGFSFDPPDNQTWLKLSVDLSTGADFVEFDVHLTSDHVPIVFHDFRTCLTLLRHDGSLHHHKVLVKDLSLEQLRALRLKHRKAEYPYSDDLVRDKERRPFPTLEEVRSNLCQFRKRMRCHSFCFFIL